MKNSSLIRTTFLVPLFCLSIYRVGSAADTSSTQPATEQQYAAQFPDISIAPGPFSADETSLKQYQYPQWFRDAKLGIWAHWGPQSVPMEGDWYARKMYEEGSPDYKDHLARFGHPSKFGYKDIIPLWKAENWDPEGLMKLYKQAGARYFVAQAVHHDNFDNWNSKYHRWNAVNMGPHRDIVGDWQKAAQHQGLPFGVSEHLGASFTWFQGSHGSDKAGPLAGVPYDGANPDFFDLYHYPRAANDTGWYSKDPLWQKEWYARIKDLVDNYHPDLLYSDGGVVFGNEVGQSMIADLYNTSAATHGGVVQAVYNCKQLSKGQWVQDVERGVMAGIQPNPWQTDTSIGDWFYNKHWKYQSAQWVIHSLVDIVSKNGNLLINVVQRPDGTLDDGALKIVQEMAAWTAVNGDGIYGTRPWLVYGEGKSRAKGGSFNESHNFTADDIRFTTRGNHTLYAFVLGWPDSKKVNIRSLSLAPGVTAKVNQVQLLGFDGALKWEHDSDGLHVQLPDKAPSDYAVCLKIDADDINAFKPEVAVESFAVKADASGKYSLLPDDAQLLGVIQVEHRGGSANLGHWSNSSDSPSWTLSNVSAGRYEVRISYAAGAGDSRLRLQLNDKKLDTTLKSTSGWDDFNQADLGSIDLDQARVATLTAGAVDAKSWQAINLRWVQLLKIAP